MLSERKTRRTRRRILRWGRLNYVDYLWRSETNPWLSFLAEILLQRTRAAQVEPVFRDIRQSLPTAGSLVAGGLEVVSKLTSQLGLHRKGPLLLETARKIASNGGTPPDTLQELRSLPGVGMYTAGAWLSLHRGKRAVLIDANVARWLSRMTGLPYNRDPRHVRWINELANQLTPQRVFREYNYAVLDFTMGICSPRNPRCCDCPLLSDCGHGKANHVQRRDNLHKARPSSLIARSSSTRRDRSTDAHRSH